MPATWPLPALIGEGLEHVYNNMDSKKPPIIEDLIAATENVLISGIQQRQVPILVLPWKVRLAGGPKNHREGLPVQSEHSEYNTV